MSVAQLDDKDSFIDLTPKQKSVIRAYVENPDAGHKRISERASELMDGDDTVSRSYVKPILEKYPHIAKRQLEKKDNKREEGTERTTGDPFENLDETLGDSKEWQTINDRPVKDAQSRSEQEGERTIQAELTRGDVERLLSGDVPEEFRRLLVIRIVEQAFE